MTFFFRVSTNVSYPSQLDRIAARVAKLHQPFHPKSPRRWSIRHLRFTHGKWVGLGFFDGLDHRCFLVGYIYECILKWTIEIFMFSSNLHNLPTCLPWVFVWNAPFSQALMAELYVTTFGSTMSPATYAAWWLNHQRDNHIRIMATLEAQLWLSNYMQLSFCNWWHWKYTFYIRRIQILQIKLE